MPKAKAQENFTDPDSRIMKRAGGGFDAQLRRWGVATNADRDLVTGAVVDEREPAVGRRGAIDVDRVGAPAGTA